MDALWNLEEELKISTQISVILLVCTSILVVLASFTIIVVVLKNKAAQRNRIMSHDDDSILDEENNSVIVYAATTTTTTTTPSSTKCVGFKDVRNALIKSACWSQADKWNAEDGGVMQCCIGCVRGRSKLPSVWQRPILMGEKCEFPKFSGLILYDERGRPLPHHQHYDQHHQYCSDSSDRYQVGNTFLVT